MGSAASARKRFAPTKPRRYPNTRSRASSVDVYAATATAEIEHKMPRREQHMNGDATPTSAQAYFAARGGLIELERTMGFEHKCRYSATDLEHRVDEILQRLRRVDDETVYAGASPRCDERGQVHRRFAGDHFLSNVELIEQTALFRVASRMPKGAHLHIHFNACLPPAVLLGIAKTMDRMFITSDLPLVTDAGFDKCELQFSILSLEKETPGDLFSATYQSRQTMRFAEFLKTFPTRYTKRTVDEWLVEKLVFDEYEAHNFMQTASGAWKKFNGRTRMMKGLFNYETAYRVYTRLCLEDFARDNIQYAEIRPNFMTSNQLYSDDGTGSIDNWGIMRIIISEVEAFQAAMASQGRGFSGLKVIYCTPRSMSRDNVKSALAECLDFKRHWPQWIAGFDLVGEEAHGHPLKDFVPEFLEFKEMCRVDGVDIPFLFHCGETLDCGTDTDENLVDALLLNSKRIGHGFALSKHPLIMQRMREQGVCVELCPISNEILGLTPRVSGHSMYNLLANNVHCTVSSDNGTLFRSTLSHDFYQVLIGKADMGLFGWKQLVKWSLEHSCMSDDERSTAQAQWEIRWTEFLVWVDAEYSHVLA